MQTFTKLVFDEFIYAGDWYTSSEFNVLIGSADKMGLQATVDNVTTASGTLDVRVQHSGDGRNWADKNTTNEIAMTGLSTSAQTTKGGSDDGTKTGLGLGRLKITLGTATSAHVRVWVTGRIT